MFRAAFACLFFVACAATPESAPKRAPTRALPTRAELPKGEIVRTSRPADFAAMIEDLAQADVVFVGEEHTKASHHRVQLLVIEQLHARGRLHGIGMEMFQRRFQPALDDYVFGRIGEEEMLARTEYKIRWGYDYALYRPILEFARKHRLPVVALNVEDEIRKPARKGGLDAVADELRKTLPAIDTTIAPHRAYLETIYGHIAAHRPKDKEVPADDFDRFYLVQCLWEDVMADSVVRWFRKAPEDAQMVVLAGGGHVANRYGIPDRVERRLGRPQRVVVPTTRDEARMHARGYADFLWLTG